MTVTNIDCDYYISTKKDNLCLVCYLMVSRLEWRSCNTVGSMVSLEGKCLENRIFVWLV